MKKLLFCLLLVSCASDEINYTPGDVVFEPVSYITLTNENTGGGSQIAYHLSGLNEQDLIFCFCQEEGSRELIVVSELEFNPDTTDFRYKINLDDDFQTKSSTDWCTRYK